MHTSKAIQFDCTELLSHHMHGLMEGIGRVHKTELKKAKTQQSLSDPQSPQERRCQWCNKTKVQTQEAFSAFLPRGLSIQSSSEDQVHKSTFVIDPGRHGSVSNYNN